MARDLVFVFCYDIADNRVRARVAKMLEQHGTRVQESVFEVHAGPAAAQALMARLERLRMPGDSLRMYCLTPDGRARSRVAGGAPLPEATEFWLL